jgi:hypothetical protein
LAEEAKAHEIRIAQGYQARWEFKPTEIAFRRLVEPMREDGQAKRPMQTAPVGALNEWSVFK